MSSCKDNSKYDKSIVQLSKYKNGKVKFEKMVLKADSLDFRCRSYYPNGQLESEYFIKDSMLHGVNKTYYSNGKLKFEGKWSNGKKDDYFKYYDSLGHLDKIVQFIPFQDTAISRPNQIFKIGPNGDTLLNGQSLYYEHWKVKDTVKYKQEFYNFKLVLRGRIFKNARVMFCDYDRYYKLLPNGECGQSEMADFVWQGRLVKQNLGENIIRGEIMNYDVSKKPDGTDSFKVARLYFTLKYYVIP
jgi:hypothetical protein